MFFWIHAFEGPDFLGFQVSQGPGFSGAGSRVQAQVLEVAFPKNTSGHLLLTMRALAGKIARATILRCFEKAPLEVF